MKRCNITLVIGCFFCVLITSIYTRQLIVFADDLEEEAAEITEQIQEEEENIEDLEQVENEEEDPEQLHDVIAPISEDVPRIEEDQTDYQDRDNVQTDTQEDEETMTDNNNNPLDIMILFTLGIIAGVIVGHFLTGFIK